MCFTPGSESSEPDPLSLLGGGGSTITMGFKNDLRNSSLVRLAVSFSSGCESEVLLLTKWFCNNSAMKLHCNNYVS